MLYELGQFVCFPSSDGIYLFINLIKSEFVGYSILDIVTQKDRRIMKKRITKQGCPLCKGWYSV